MANMLRVRRISVGVTGAGAANSVRYFRGEGARLLLARQRIAIPDTTLSSHTIGAIEIDSIVSLPIVTLF